MAILMRFICSRHGEFDAWNDEAVRCPAPKCRCKPRQMVSAPAVHGANGGYNYKKADETLKNLASDFNMTDMRSVKEGDSQSGFHHHGGNQQPPPPGSGVMWGNAGGMNLDSIVKGSKYGGAGVKPGDLGVNRGPTTASYIADHENLKISK